MAHDDLILPTAGLRRPVALSATLHGLVMTAVVFGATSGAQRVEHDERAVAERTAAAQTAAAVAERGAAQVAAAAAAAGGVRAELDAALAGALTADPGLAEEVGADLATFFNAQDLAALDSQAAAQLQAQARQQAMRELDGMLEQRLRAALVAEVRAHIRNEVAPELSARVADELERRLDGPAKQAARAGGLAALAAAEPQLVEVVAKAVADEAVPRAAQRVTEGVRDGLKRLGEDPARFAELVAGDIRSALDESLAGAATPIAGAALVEARRDLGEVASGVEAAQLAAQAAAERLTSLAGRERALRSNAGDPAPGDALAEQKALAGEIATAERAARQAGRTARLVASQADGAADRVAEALRASQAARHAAAAADSWQAGAIEETRQAMGHAADDLERTARALGEVAQGLAAAAKPGSRNGGAAADAAQQVQAAATGAAAEAARRAGERVETGDTFASDGETARLVAARERLRQLMANAQSGRVPSATDLAGVGLGLGGASGASGATGAGSAARSRWNREAYEAFVKDLRARAAPGNQYATTAFPAGLEARAELPATAPPRLWFPAPRSDASAVAPPVRTLAQPTFAHAAFGAAAFQSTPITLDGDLSEWGELAHPMAMRYRFDGSPLADGTAVHLRWNADGLYLAWRVRKSGPIVTGSQPYQGDGLEVWIDCDNSRRSEMTATPSSHQFILCPFGTRGQAAATFAEIGRDQRGMRRHQAYLDAHGARGAAVAVRTPDGYQGEALIRVGTLARPALVPGQWLAVNFSVNTTERVEDGTQWSAPKSIMTWDKPDTWGDVLMLGADAQVTFRDPADPARATPCAAVGWPLCIEVADGDMDLDRTQPDRVAVELTGEGGGPVLAVLAETGPSTGLFRGTIATQHHLAAAQAGAVPLRAGSIVTLTYRDPRAAFGEHDRLVTATLPVGVPVSDTPGTQP